MRPSRFSHAEAFGAFFAPSAAFRFVTAALIAAWTSRLQGSRLEQEVLVRPVERLVAFGSRIPAHPDRQHVRIGGAFQRRKVKLQTLLFTLLELQSPASYGRQRRQPEKAFLVFQMFIASQKLGPLAVSIFHYHRACHDGSR